MVEVTDAMLWKVGQQAVINRRTIITIERLTPSGRVVADGRTFDVRGWERTTSFRRDRLEPLTPEIQAEMALVKRGRKASAEASNLTDATDRWLRRAFSSWYNNVPDADDVNKAEKLVCALREVMGDALK